MKPLKMLGGGAVIENTVQSYSGMECAKWQTGTLTYTEPSINADINALHC